MKKRNVRKEHWFNENYMYGGKQKLPSGNLQRIMILTVEYDTVNAGRNINRPLRIKQKRGRGKKQWKLTNFSLRRQSREYGKTSGM